MSTVSSIRLFEAEPDLARYLTPEDAKAARDVRLPLLELPPGDAAIRQRLKARGSFAAILTDGMLLQSLRLGEHAGLRLLGPGDVVSLTETPPSMLVLDSTCRVTVPSRLALLGRELLVACRRWPWLIAGLHGRMSEQSERLTTQLMICQLPRVDDRLLAMMWLLAESWGQVTGGGTFLPVELTHSALGGLVGARRPTVTLALSELTARGAIVRQAEGWLLLDELGAPEPGRDESAGTPRLVEPRPSGWRRGQQTINQRQQTAARAELRETVDRLRQEHSALRENSRERLSQLISLREKVVSSRQARRPKRRPPPRAPSSGSRR